MNGGHRAQQAHRTADVVVKVLQWFRHALAHRLVAREMHHACWLAAPQDGFHPSRVQHIAALQRDGSPGDVCQPLQHHRVAVGEIVEDHGLKARFAQSDGGVAADVTGTAGEEDVHGSEGEVGFLHVQK